MQAAREFRPDLTILDVMMATQTEGVDVARQLSQDPELKGMKILLVTGVSQALHLPFALEPDGSWLPVCRVLEKPIAPTMLIKEIEKTLHHAETKGA